MPATTRTAGRTFPLLALPAALALAGCGSGTAVVSGTVTYRGTAVPGGSVVLYCSDRQIVHGTIDPDGRYTIPNVPAGTAVVTVQTHARVPAGMRFRQNLPPSVNGPVPPGAGAADPAVLIPPRYALPEESGLTVVIDRAQVAFDLDLRP